MKLSTILTLIATLLTSSLTTASPTTNLLTLRADNPPIESTSTTPDPLPQNGTSPNPSAPTFLPFTESDTFPNVPITYTRHIAFHDNGDVRYFTHFLHTSGNDILAYGLCCALQDATGRVYTLMRRGFVGPAGTDLATDVHDPTGNFPVVAAGWVNIIGGDRKPHCARKAERRLTAEDFRRLFDEAVGKVARPVRDVIPLF